MNTSLQKSSLRQKVTEKSVPHISRQQENNNLNHQRLIKMVTKSKLKMALVAEKQTDFKKQHQKKMSKQARKEQKATQPAVVNDDDDEEEEDEEGIQELMELDEKETGDEHQPTEVS
jgi:hypothetical protein